MNTILAVLCTLLIWPIIIFGPYYLSKFLLVNLLKHLPPPKGGEKIACWLMGAYIILLSSGSLYFLYLTFQLFNNLISGV